MRNKPFVKIHHPMADEVSIQDSPFHMGRAGSSSEMAFFLNREWVIEPIPEFAEYHDGSPSDALTAVYAYVPNELIDEFLEKYKA